MKPIVLFSIFLAVAVPAGLFGQDGPRNPVYLEEGSNEKDASLVLK